jgi:hypothetical protein
MSETGITAQWWTEAEFAAGDTATCVHWLTKSGPELLIRPESCAPAAYHMTPSTIH